MKRKVNRVGQNTLTISLPAKWAKNNNIKPGDELEIFEEPKLLMIHRKKARRKIKKVVLNLDYFNKVMLNRHLIEFYREGVEKIVLKFSKETIPDYKFNRELNIESYINKTIDRFIGMEVISQTSNTIILESLITKEESEKRNIILKRTFFLIKEFLDEFIKHLDEDFKKFHTKCYDYHDNIAKFTYYYLRLLNFSDISDEKKSQILALFMVIDKVIDKIRHTSERVNEMKRITPKIKIYLDKLFSLFLEEFNFILKTNYKLGEIEDLIKRRYALVKKVNLEKFTYEELKVISECNIILDTINDFSEAYVALRIENYLQEI